MTSTLDFYNISNASWEPVMERWMGEMEITTDGSGNQLAVRSLNTMQLTVSGALLNMLLQTYSLVLKMEDSMTRDAAPEMAVRNQLGVPVELYDSRTRTKLLSLLSDTMTPLRRAATAGDRDGRGSGQMRVQQSPMLLDLHFTDKLGQDRRPLFHLPTSVRNPRAFHVRPVSDDVAGSNTEAVHVVEEIFENQRYSILTLSWTSPFLLTDPRDWSNAFGSPLDITDVKLPNDSWEWQTDWSIDLTGVGEEVDEGGWEYALDFSYFSGTSKRHLHQSLDCVRRRRWTRVRVPKSAPIDDPHRPLTVFWDVTSKGNGSKLILIRSGVQIANYMNFPVLIALGSSAWQSDQVFGPIEPHRKFSVPLLYAYASTLRIRPAVLPYDWSQKLPCNTSTSDFKSTYDVDCEGMELSTIYMRVLFKQVDRSLLVTLVPYVIVTNRLPCLVNFKCSSSDQQQEEEGVLDPGASCKLSHVNRFRKPKVSFKVGKFDWSVPVLVSTALRQRADVDLAGTNGLPALVISVRAKLGQAQTSEIFVFSTGALIDRSGLSVSVKGFASNGVTPVRRDSYNPAVSRHRRSGSGFPPRATLEDVQPLDAPVLVLERLRVRSRRRYVVTTAEVGDLVYTDRDWRWTRLPAIFSGAIYLRPPCDDRFIRINQLMDFTVNRRAVVYVVYDVTNSLPPNWLVSGGFRRLSEQSSARRVFQGQVHTHQYVAWGKQVNAAEHVVLGSNGFKESRSMYVVFIAPATCSRHAAELLDQLPADHSSKQEDAQSSWIYGGNGICLYHVTEGKISVGVMQGAAWCEQVNTQLISSSKGLFEVVDPVTRRGYQLAYSVTAMSVRSSPLCSRPHRSTNSVSRVL